MLAGRWPEKWDECVVVLTQSEHVPDITLYNLGLKDPAELDELTKAYSEGVSLDTDETPRTYDYDEFLGIDFKLLSATDYYTYDKQYKVWTDRSEDTGYMNKMLDKAENIRIVGIVKPDAENLSPILPQGICYDYSITEHLIELSKDTDIVKAQLKTPKINVLTGKPFGEREQNNKIDFSTFFSVDKKAIDKLFNFDVSDFQLPDFSSLNLSDMDFSDINLTDAMPDMDFSKVMPKLTEKDIQELFKSVNFTVTAESMQSLFEKLLKGYADFAKDDPTANMEHIAEAFAAYITSPDARDILFNDLSDIVKEKSQYLIKQEDIADLIQTVMDGYPQYLVDNDLSETITYEHLADYLQTEQVRKIIEERVAEMRGQLSKLLITTEDVAGITKDLIAGYEPYATENKLPTVSSLMSSFTKYLSSDGAKKLISSTVTNAVDASAMEKTIARYTDVMADQLSGVVSRLMDAVKSQISSALEGAMASLSGMIPDDLLSAFNFDFKPADLAKLIKFNLDAQELKDLMTSLLSTTQTTLETNLRKMGYADINKPASITIYPTDFEGKTRVKKILDGYNNRMREQGEDDKVIEYTDIVDSLMGTVTTIIDVISYILIAFVAISLVVSSIMIGVITYISVLERRKEIGILRAIGASKHNVSSVFNAETFIIGTLAGLIGIGITQLLIIPANLIIHAVTGQSNLNAILTPSASLILIALSIVLTLIGGIIPSHKAAKSDPVAALRSE